MAGVAADVKKEFLQLSDGYVSELLGHLEAGWQNMSAHCNYVCVRCD